MYRTGKSYLLNQMLLNRSDGFGVGPTVNPCTKVFKNKIKPKGSMGLGKAIAWTNIGWGDNSHFSC